MCTHIHAHPHIYMWRAVPHAHPRTSTHIQFLVLSFCQFATVVSLITDITYLCFTLLSTNRVLFSTYLRAHPNPSAKLLSACYGSISNHRHRQSLPCKLLSTNGVLSHSVFSTYLRAHPNPSAKLLSTCYSSIPNHRHRLSLPYELLSTNGVLSHSVFSTFQRAHQHPCAKLRPACYSSIPNPKSQISPIFALRALV